eukprot:3011029-Prymnesium_polylepis.1
MHGRLTHKGDYEPGCGDLSKNKRRSAMAVSTASRVHAHRHDAAASLGSAHQHCADLCDLVGGQQLATRSSS